MNYNFRYLEPIAFYHLSEKDIKNGWRHLFRRKPDGTLNYSEKYLVGNKEIVVTDSLCEPMESSWLLDRLESNSIEYLGIGIKKDHYSLFNDFI